MSKISISQITKKYHVLRSENRMKIHRNKIKKFNQFKLRHKNYLLEQYYLNIYIITFHLIFGSISIISLHPYTHY